MDEESKLDEKIKYPKVILNTTIITIIKLKFLEFEEFIIITILPNLLL